MRGLRRWIAVTLCLVAPGLCAAPWQGFTCLALSPDGRSFATGGRGGEILLWETSTGELEARWNTPGAVTLVGLAFDADGTHLGAAALDGSLFVAVPSGGELESLKGSRGWDSLTAASERWRKASPLGSGIKVVSGDLWAKGTPEGQITVGDRTGLTLASWSAHQSAVTGLVLSADGSLLISCSYAGGLSLWNPRTGQNLGSLQSPQN